MRKLRCIILIGEFWNSFLGAVVGLDEGVVGSFEQKGCVGENMLCRDEYDLLRALSS